MNKINFLRILLAVTIAAMTLTVVTPAFAEGPEYLEIPVDLSYTFPSPCEFDIEGHDTGILKIHIFNSENGIGPNGLIAAPNMKSTWSANGKSFVLHLGGPEHRYGFRARNIAAGMLARGHRAEE